MNRPSVQEEPIDLDAFHARVQELGRESLEGSRPLSELLGQALHELRVAAASLRLLQARAEPGADLDSMPRTEEGGLADPGDVSVSPIGDAWAGNGSRPNAFRGDSPARALPLEVGDHPERPDLDLFTRPVPERPELLEAALRSRVAGALYLNTLREGDRLPSIRELSRWTGFNHKVVRRVYRSLERRGLIEVRDRSGIYITRPEPRLPGDAPPLESWVAGVLLDAVGHGIPASHLPGLFQHSVGARRLRCACVDSTEDDRYALSREVGDRFGLEAVPVDSAADEIASILCDVDLAVTTPYHAEEVRGCLAPTQPLVVVGLHPAWWQRVAELTAEGDLRLVCVDRQSGNRLRHALGPELAQRLEVASVAAASNGPPPGPTLATPAALARLNGGASADVVSPPYLSPRAARQLARVIVHLNLARR